MSGRVPEADMDLRAFLDGVTERDWQDAAAEDGSVRLALVGLGWWTTEKAIPAIRESELCETTVLVSGSAERAAALADEEGFATGIDYEAFHDGAAADEYDAVYVGTPNGTHLEFVETAADLGKAVLCEKPLERSVDRAEAAVDAATDADVPFMVAYRMHTDPAVRRMREAIAQGVVGDPVHVRGHMTQSLLDVIPDPDQWRLDPDIAGPGVSITDIGVYPLNTARFVLDDDPVAVGAMMDTTDGAFDAVPDEQATFTARFASGTLGSFTVSQRAHHTSRLQVVGTDGQAVLDPAFFPDRSRKLTLTNGDTTVSTSVEAVDQMREEFDYFADCVLGDRTPHADGDHGLVDMRAIEAIYEAADRGRQVTV
jgi:predicted dehydrogenase